MTDNNRCECPMPPGGHISCRRDQLAICRVRNGVIDAECADLPKDLKGIRGHFGDARDKWFISRIKDVPLRSIGKVTDADRRMLKEGSYTDPESGMLVKFRVPDKGKGDLPESRPRPSPAC